MKYPNSKNTDHRSVFCCLDLEDRMKEEVSCEYKNTKGLLQKFQRSCYGTIKSKKLSREICAFLVDIKRRVSGKLPQMR